MELREMKPILKKWEVILCENVISLTGNKDHQNACLVCIHYCLATQKPFNLAYYMAKKMVGVIKNDVMMLPYGMLVTRLYRFMSDGIRPHPPTSSSSSSSSLNLKLKKIMTRWTTTSSNQLNFAINFHPFSVPWNNLRKLRECSSVLVISSPTLARRGNILQIYALKPSSNMTKASSVCSSTKNPPRKMIKTNVIDISSNESSPLREPSNNYITTHTTPLETSPPLTSYITTPLVIPPIAPQPTTPTTLAPRELAITTPPISPHLYLHTLEDLPQRCTNPSLFPTLELLVSQPFHLPDNMEVEPFFPPTNLNRRNIRLSAYPEPNLTLVQIIKELNEL
nr:hypothetical protein [Tanacetum cinerariifolium]